MQNASRQGRGGLGGLTDVSGIIMGSAVGRRRKGGCSLERISWDEIMVGMIEEVVVVHYRFSNKVEYLKVGGL